MSTSDTQGDNEHKAPPIENSMHASVAFDFAKVDGIEHLIPDEPTIADLALAAIAFREVLEWVANDGRGRAKPRTAIIRLYAFLWCIHPECLRGCSQADLAAHLGCTRNELNRQVTAFRDRFNFKCSRMRSEEVVETYRDKAIAQHAATKKSSRKRGRRHARDRAGSVQS